MNWEKIAATTDPADLLPLGIRLHGHKGPFLAVGIRMGLLALRLLGSTGFTGITAEAYTGPEPPISCLVDGLQIATGCTAGKGNLRVLAGGKAEAVFSAHGRILRVALREEWLQRLLSAGAKEGLTEEVLQVPAEALLTWNLSSS